MLEENHNHESACSSPADVVSYLYDEIGGAEKLRFESHLAGCQACTDIFADLSEARFSVFEWNRHEFLPMETPDFSGPWTVPAVSVSAGGLAISKLGWLERVKEIVTRYPSWTLVSVGFASIVVVVGVAFFSFGGSAVRQEVVGVDEEHAIPPVIEESPDKSAPPPSTGTEDTHRNVLPNNEVKAVDDRSKPDRARPASQSNVVRIATVPSQRQGRKIAKNLHNNRLNASSGRKAPNLNNFVEEEDNSIRLSDLFAELEKGR